MQTLTFVDTAADAEGSTIVLRECCSGKLKMRYVRHMDTEIH